MAGRTSVGHITEAEYQAILQALSANPKGRSFLREYARRAAVSEAAGLLEALQRIEASIGSVRDQLQPERMADELRRVAMTLEIALEGADCDPNGAEPARRMALVGRCRHELAILAAGLAPERASPAR